MTRPAHLIGLAHVALRIPDHCFSQTVEFYTHLVGMTVDWSPDEDNVYLTNGTDNLALHRHMMGQESNARLDHIGFILDSMHAVDRWHDFLSAQGVPIVHPPCTHRDRSRSFYCRDPAAILVQFMCLPSAPTQPN